MGIGRSEIRYLYIVHALVSTLRDDLWSLKTTVFVTDKNFLRSFFHQLSNVDQHCSRLVFLT